jgi:hypothetical protein
MMKKGGAANAMPGATSESPMKPGDNQQQEEQQNEENIQDFM